MDNNHICLDSDSMCIALDTRVTHIQHTRKIYVVYTHEFQMRLVAFLYCAPYARIVCSLTSPPPTHFFSPLSLYTLYPPPLSLLSFFLSLSVSPPHHIYVSIFLSLCLSSSLSFPSE